MNEANLRRSAPRETGPSKWRPSLGMITFAVIATVMALPLVGLLFFRLYENQLVRATEGELIAQGAALAAIYAAELARADAPDALLGPAAPPPPGGEFARAIEPSLDLAGRETLPPRQAAELASRPVDPLFRAVGARLAPIAEELRQVTLAGVRLLDPSGVVIAGGGEIGLSLAHAPEVATALSGRFRSVMRARPPDWSPAALTSLSRGAGVRVFTATPVILRGRVAGAVYLSRTPNNILRHLYRERRKALFAALSVLGAALALGFVFLRTIARPLRMLNVRAQAIARGEREAIGPLPNHGTREVALLTRSFMSMAESLFERSDYLSTFAAHVTHELKSPLTAIQGAAELLADSGGAMTQAERARFLGNIQEDARKLTLLVERLRDLARADNPQTGGETNLAALAAALRAGFPKLTLTVAGDPGLRLPMSRDNALIVFANLLDNAGRHGAGRVALTAEAGARRLRITVADNGAGVTANNRGNIFDAFFTTRREQGGAGMGLGIVRAMLRAHGGDIRLLAAEEGAAFEITLPRMEVGPSAP